MAMRDHLNGEGEIRCLYCNVEAGQAMRESVGKDANGIQGCYVGDLPEQLAALNRTNINPQLLAIEAALTGKKEHIYHAAMLDPHTAAELPIDQIKAMCDELIEEHGDWLPEYK